jgi:uncharacterized RDD family membrane protein YckC
MDEQNPYRGPDAAVAEIAGSDELAGRGARLGAWIIDFIILVIIMLPIMYMGGYFSMVRQVMATGQQPGLSTGLMWNLISLVVFAVVQFFPLNASGQTWGKKLLKIRIVDLQGQKPDMTKLMGLRYLLVYVISCIPFVGFVIYIANVLMIFRNDRRCGHDLVAGTRVVHAD